MVPEHKTLTKRAYLLLNSLEVQDQLLLMLKIFKRKFLQSLYDKGVRIVTCDSLKDFYASEASLTPKEKRILNLSIYDPRRTSDLEKTQEHILFRLNSQIYQTQEGLAKGGLFFPSLKLIVIPHKEIHKIGNTTQYQLIDSEPSIMFPEEMGHAIYSFVLPMNNIKRFLTALKTDLKGFNVNTGWPEELNRYNKIKALTPTEALKLLNQKPKSPKLSCLKSEVFAKVFGALLVTKPNSVFSNMDTMRLQPEYAEFMEILHAFPAVAKEIKENILPKVLTQEAHHALAA